MNVNPTLVRTEVVVWLITLVEDLIVNVHWDSEEPPVWVGFLKKNNPFIPNPKNGLSQHLTKFPNLNL